MAASHMLNSYGAVQIVKRFTNFNGRQIVTDRWDELWDMFVSQLRH